MRQNKRFQNRNFEMEKLMKFYNKDWHPNNSIYFMKIKNASFDGKLVFVNVLMTYEKDKHCEVVLTMSQKVAEHLLQRLNSQLRLLKGGDE
jgi:hypothetical protein